MRSIRVFVLDDRVVNADNNEDAARWLKRGARELSAEEIASTFGDDAHLAGPHNTTVHADGSITFTPPPALDRASIYSMKQCAIRDGAEAILSPLRSEYGPTEIASWDQQWQEAVAVQADPAAPAPLIRAIANARGMAPEVLAQRIIANREAWVAISGHVVGQRLAYQDALEATAAIVDDAEAVLAIHAINPVYTLPEADNA